MAFYERWAPYVPVAQRRAKATREASKLAKNGQNLRPIRIQSRAIATSFWGLAWCKNLEIYSDWANRMPRGRTYARNGSIVDLQIEPGKINAMVSGSSLYKIKISIDRLDAKTWKAIRNDCARQVSSLLDLMRGKLPDFVLTRLTDPKQGMFPSPKELKLQCSCPDYAKMCKHVAATLYGVGHLLDTEPALFFKMRGVDQSELVSDAITTQTTDDAIGLNQQSDLAGEDLSAIFGIDLATSQDGINPVGNHKPPVRNRKRVAAANPNPKLKPKKASPAVVNDVVNDVVNETAAIKKAVKVKSSAPVKRGRSTSTKTAQTKTENAVQKPLGKKAPSKKAPSKKATAVSPLKSKAKSARQVAKKPIVAPAKKRMATINKTRKSIATKAKF